MSEAGDAAGPDRVGARAGELFDAGKNCARAVLQATTGSEDPALLAASEGFAAGIGDRGCLCGALAGGVMALGLEGRSQLCGALVDRFRARHGQTCCRGLSAAFRRSSDQHLANCRHLTVTTAVEVARLLDEGSQVIPQA